MSLNNGNLKTAATNHYNELGQVTNNDIYKSSVAEILYNTTYQYNIRGWMTNMDNTGNNQSLFNLQLGYNTIAPGVVPQYNGNISTMSWNSSILNNPKSYNFEYDKINRLKKANYQGAGPENYSTTYEYDRNGNITNLSRYGLTTVNSYPEIDQLSYSYQGNRLIGVSDNSAAIYQTYGFKEKSYLQATEFSSHEYLYDANGNLIKDLNKGIDKIVYNYLNLPTEITMAGLEKIEYIYDAAGIKLQQKANINGSDKTIDYVGNFIYKEKELDFIITDNGRMLPKADGSFDYEYFIKDHLGNTRVTIQEKEGLPFVMQENHYDPFGMALAGQTYTDPSQTVKNDYLYNGKELQSDLSLDWYDYGARFYDATLGRFHTQDPLSEKYTSWTPYNYVFNNPTSMTDPTGMEGTDWYKAADGQYLWKAGTEKSVTLATKYDNDGNVLESKEYNWVASNGQKLGTGGIDLIITPGGNQGIKADASAVKTTDGLSNVSAIAIAENQSEFISAMINTTASFESIDNVAYVGHSTNLEITFDGKSGMSYNGIDAISSLIKTGGIKLAPDATFIFASCNSENFASSFKSSTGFSSIGANDQVGSSHYLKGNGSFNTELVEAGSNRPEIGFTRFNQNANSQQLGKIINIPSLFQTGKNSQTMLKSPYTKY